MIVTAISVVPLTILACITGFLAWGFILVRTAFISVQASVLAIFDFFFIEHKPSYPRLGSVNHGRPPTYEEWCAIVDTGPYHPNPPFPRLPEYMMPSDSSDDVKPPKPSSSFLQAPDESPTRRRKSTGAITTPHLHSRSGQPPDIEETTEVKFDEWIEVKDYGFPVSPEDSVFDENGEFRDLGLYGSAWDLLWSAYNRGTDRYTAWWEVPSRTAGGSPRRARKKKRGTGHTAKNGHITKHA
ncbi:hypothetical protein N657DRAFT_642777 [Parathielavia appendiculata]|uniref:Uncharacterized protein n=1 Tax=Parathielavia appendiculata TaxID=2587402 RepID=A0AAN6U4V5_9PEZI|nr:hypothetical protein N657DRAFT_642777 [Parathielavia appendiculata]